MCHDIYKLHTASTAAVLLYPHSVPAWLETSDGGHTTATAKALSNASERFRKAHRTRSSRDLFQRSRQSSPQVLARFKGKLEGVDYIGHRQTWFLCLSLTRTLSHRTAIPSNLAPCVALFSCPVFTSPLVSIVAGSRT